MKNWRQNLVLNLWRQFLQHVSGALGTVKFPDMYRQAGIRQAQSLSSAQALLIPAQRALVRTGKICVNVMRSRLIGTSYNKTMCRYGEKKESVGAGAGM